MNDFKPSEVNLAGSCPPLVGTFRKTEAEVCAAWLIRTCSLSGDEWRPLTWEEVRARMVADIGAGNDWGLLARNPFARPDPDRLVSDGFAEWVGEDGPELRLQFTATGYEALRKWVKTR